MNCTRHSLDRVRFIVISLNPIVNEARSCYSVIIQSTGSLH
jgi:hypothetical protein